MQDIVTDPTLNEIIADTTEDRVLARAAKQ